MICPCEMIRDLIPLVHDQVASESSERAVREHLAGCEECRQYYELCRQELHAGYEHQNENEEKTVSSAKTYTGRVKRRYYLMIGGAVAVTAAVFIAFILFIAAKLTIWADRYETSDIAEYGNYEGHIAQEERELLAWTRLSMFPSEIKDEYEVNSYYYACDGMGFENGYLMFLDYTLPAEDFAGEIERIRNQSVTYQGKTNVPIYDEDNFSYPAYVNTFRRGRNSDDFGVFEYALIDEENYRIISVLVIEGYLSRLPADETLKPPADLDYSDDVLGVSIYSFPSGNAAIYVLPEE